jgi:pimeloyl-ACP methyl ester carboxylesterase
MRIVPAAALALGAFLVLGCGDNLHGPVAAADAGPPPRFPPALLAQTVTFTACPLYDDQEGAMAECADVAVPLFWDDPEGETITIHVKRLQGPGPLRRQLFMLDGGPGGAGTTDYPRYLELLTQNDPALEVYTLDHRGTGHSNRLGCPAEEDESSDWGIFISEAEWPACLESLAARGVPLEAYTTTAAARDVGLLVELMTVPGRDRFVYGASYGTYLANRYGQLYPGQATGLVLDSICPPGTCLLDRQDALANDVVHEVFDLCAADELCAAKLGDDPWGKAQAVLASMADGHCPAFMALGLTFANLQQVPFVLAQRFALRPLVPAIYYRMDRCDPGDVTFLRNLVMAYLATDTSADAPAFYRQFSYVVSHNITFSELMSEPLPTRDDLAALDATLLATSHNGATLVDEARAWPVYPRDSFYGGWTGADVPILMLNGTLDIQTPLVMAAAARDHLTGPDQRFYELPGAAHGTIAQSPDVDPDRLPCGMRILLSWLADPTVAPDRSCLETLLPVDFHGYGDRFGTATELGTADLWENTSGVRSRPATRGAVLPRLAPPPLPPRP